MYALSKVFVAKRYLKTIPEGAKSFSDTHYDIVFSVTADTTIVEIIFTVWRFNLKTMMLL